MELNEQNIIEWKKELDELMKTVYPKMKRYSDCLSDEQWLYSYTGQTPEDVKNDDLTHSY